MTWEHDRCCDELPADCCEEGRWPAGATWSGTQSSLAPKQVLLPGELILADGTVVVTTEVVIE